MPSPSTDRNLLFGILALQMDFINRDQLVAAMNAWVLKKDKPLGQVLSEQGALAKDTHALLDALVGKHLALHGNDAEKSLAAVSSDASVKEELARIADPDVQASLGHVAAAPATPKADPYGTRVPSIGTPSSAGLRFRILRPHARGGLGEVLVAHDEELHRQVVLKQIQEKHADNPDSRARFLIEAEITGGLEHPGIVPVYGLGTYADGRPFYAMRFIRGDSLKEAVDRFHREDTPGRDAGARALELRKLLGRLIDVCNAVSYAHSRGVLHRDLKPGNIMLGKYGETLVVDWGLAKPLDKDIPDVTVSEEGSLTLSKASMSAPTLLGAAVGTPQFMSPEQAGGRLDQLGPASDVYSLGATLYCLLTGQTPFPGEDVGELLRKVQRGEFARPRQLKASVPPALEAICLKAMALEPRARYATPNALAEDLEKWLADEPVSAWSEPWTVRAGRWLRRNQTLAAGVASAVLVTAVGLGVATALLTAANERERQAKTKAEENFRLARQAVDRYHTEVSESVLLHEPGMQPLRKRLLEAANEFYDKFVQERQGDPSVKTELGKALYRLAQISGDIESEQRAIELHRQALKVFEELAAAGPELQSDLAQTHHQLGRFLRLTNQLAAAEEEYKKALAIWQKLESANPNETRFQAEIARSQLGLGNVLHSTGRPGLAEDMYRSALKVRRRLADDSPKAAELQRDLAVTHSNLALVLQTLGGKDTDAEKSLRDAIRIQDQLTRDFPHISQYRADLGRSYYNLGEYYRALERLEDAEGFLSKSAEAWKELVARHPTVLDFQALSADTRGAVADVISARGGHEAAEKLGREALADQRKLAEEHQDLANYQAYLADGLERLGDIVRRGAKNSAAETAFKESAQVWERLTKANPAVPEFALGLGRTRYKLGNLARAQDQLASALDWYGGAIRALEAPGREGTLSAKQQDTLVQVLVTRAELQTKQGKHQEALADLDRARPLASPSQQPWLRLSRAAALARLGDHKQAVAEVEPLAKTKSGDALFQIATVYSLAAKAAENDSATSTGQPPLPDQYAARACELLESANGLGFFRSLESRARLENSQDLDPLRQREEFKKLLRQIKSKNGA